MSAYSTPATLARGRHVIEEFECTSVAQTVWLKEHSLASHRGGFTSVVVTTEISRPDVVVGYYALAAASILSTAVTARARAGGGGHAVPSVLLARLAVDCKHEGQGLGAQLLLHAVRRTTLISETLGTRVLMVHCESVEARNFYLHVMPTFVALPEDGMTLISLVKDLRHTLSA